MRLPPDTPLGVARAQLRQCVDEGAHCPCCTQFAKVYKRSINSTMARCLITIWRAAPFDFVHVPSLPGDTHEVSQLAWWGLVEEELKVRLDGGRAGWWRITEHGKRWLHGSATVPRYARIYDHRLLNLVGDPITAEDALGTKFDLRQLMNA